MQILRRIFPIRTRCPVCGCTHWDAAGGTSSGQIHYRRCGTGHVYKVAPIACEVLEQGRQVSRIIPA